MSANKKKPIFLPNVYVFGIANSLNHKIHKL